MPRGPARSVRVRSSTFLERSRPAAAVRSGTGRPDPGSSCTGGCRPGDARPEPDMEDLTPVMALDGVWPTPSPARFLYRPAAMRIGVAREIKQREYRVALTPAGALELVQRGHEVDRRAGRRRRLGLRRRGLHRGRRADRSGRRGLGLGRAAAEGEGADRRGVRPAPRGSDALHVPPHRRRRAADARAARIRHHRRSRTRRSRRPTATCRCSRR